MLATPENFSELVKNVRTQLGLSQEELARALGVCFSTINRWENGKTTPFKLARAQFDAFCLKMTRQRKLHVPSKNKESGQ